MPFFLEKPGRFIEMLERFRKNLSGLEDRTKTYLPGFVNVTGCKR